MKSMDRILEEDAQREMDALEQKLREEEPNVSVKCKLLKSEAVAAITSLGNSGSYDFIVMGTKGASGLKEVFMGSVAGGVVSHSTAPVLVVPDEAVYQPLDEIVLAVSDIPFSSVAVVEPLQKIARAHSSKINILHLSENEQPELGGALKVMEEFNPSVIYGFGTGNINERLREHLQEENAGLMCLVRRSKGGFITRLLGGSVTLKQTFSSPVPLLILHDD